MKKIPRAKTALIILPHYLGTYNPNLEQWSTEAGRPEKPLLYSEYFFKKIARQSQVKDWLLNPTQRKQDLVTDDGAAINGSEFEIVILLKKKTAKLDINACMRCTTQLIVANYEENDYSDNYVLHQAALDGNLIAVQNVCQKNEYILLETDPYDRIPLDCAKKGGHEEIVQYFGKDLNFVQKLARDGDLERIEILFEFGVDLNIKFGLQQKTVLSIATSEGRLSLVEFLINKVNANVNVKDLHGRTPLFIASQNGHLDIVRCLIDNGADANAKNSSGKTPLSIAQIQCHTDVVQFIKLHLDEY